MYTCGIEFEQVLAQAPHRVLTLSMNPTSGACAQAGYAELYVSGSQSDG